MLLVVHVCKIFVTVRGQRSPRSPARVSDRAKFFGGNNCIWAHRAILTAMARRTLIMLITLLALQFSWSAVSAYCMHETGTAAQHFGHHADGGGADDVVSPLKDKPADAKKTSAHSHCWSCAHGTLSVNSFEGMSHPQIAEVAPVSTEVYLSSCYTARPERPQWGASA